MKNITPERAKYHKLLKQFKQYLPDRPLVYDIGLSNTHDYGGAFIGCDYKTIDRNYSTKVDICLDIEGEFILPQADGVLCMGVAEQCDNPFKMLEGVNKLLKVGGHALFGIISVGYPIYDLDFFRFTPIGVDKVLEGYKILTNDIVKRNSTPSYIFVIARKER